MKEEIRTFKKGDKFNFQVNDEINYFKITNLVRKSNGGIYALIDDSKNVIYKDANQLTAQREFELLLKTAVLNTEERKIYEAGIIKRCILADLTKEASVKQIAYWIWIRGFSAKKDPNFIRDIRMIDAKVSLSCNALDTIDTSACIYRNCRLELPSLNELKDWYALCSLGDGIRNPLAPTLYQFNIYYRNNDNTLGTCILSAETFSISNFIKKINIYEKDIFMITQFADDRGHIIVYPNVVKD